MRNEYKDKEKGDMRVKDKKVKLRDRNEDIMCIVERKRAKRKQ